MNATRERFRGVDAERCFADSAKGIAETVDLLAEARSGIGH